MYSWKRQIETPLFSFVLLGHIGKHDEYINCNDCTLIWMI